MHRALAAVCVFLALGFASACGEYESIPRDIAAAQARVASAGDIASFLTVLSAALPPDDSIIVSIQGGPISFMRRDGAWRPHQSTPSDSTHADAGIVPLAEVERVLSDHTRELSRFEVGVMIFRPSRLGAFLFSARFSDGRVSEVTPVWFST